MYVYISLSVVFTVHCLLLFFFFFFFFFFDLVDPFMLVKPEQWSLFVFFLFFFVFGVFAHVHVGRSPKGLGLTS